jgi:hypothetical protein
VWVVAVLYTTDTQNITTRDTLKSLLTVSNPGVTVPVSGGLDVMAREMVKCLKCGMPGHFARDCPNARDCPKHWPDCPSSFCVDESAHYALGTRRERDLHDPACFF